MTPRPRYTAKELEHLRILFRQKKSDDEIAAIMGRGINGIRQKRRQLGLHRPDAVALTAKHCHRWTEDELLFIRNYWRTKTDKWMAQKLGVSLASYKKKRQRMAVCTPDGIRRLVKSWTNRKGRHDTWTFNQEEFLREHYPTHSAAELSAYLGRRENAIQYKAHRMGLKKAYNPGRKGYKPIEQYYDNKTFKPTQII